LFVNEGTVRSKRHHNIETEMLAKS